MATSSTHTIVLTEKERRIFDLLLQVARHYGVVIRVAGGWVRDKLLGMDSKDIDIAVENMAGKAFCGKVNEYLSSIGEPTTVVTALASKQSEQLETAKMQLYDMWIDFVQLRAEVYSANSRVPEMRPGSAEEDAYRRDLTINSLFYNLTTCSIEDFTGRGINDLSCGRIATPIPPIESFIKDPLRVFRAIRFAARFGFVLDNELVRAAASAEVKAAIAIKLSRERIGQEVDLMICGKDPVKAMTYISDLSLFSLVFTVPPNFELASLECRLCIMNMDAVASLLNLLDCAFNDEDRRLTVYAALLLRLRKFTYKDKKSKEISLVDYVLRDSLKLKTEEAKAVIAIHSAADKFASLIPYFISGKAMDTCEVDWEKVEIDIPLKFKLQVYAGVLLDEIKSLWRISLLISTLLSPRSLNLDEKKQAFKTVESEIIKSGLEEVALGNVKPLVDGKGIMSALGLKSASSLVGEWHRKVRQWQLAHPLATKEECVAWIKESNSTRAQGSNPTVRHCVHKGRVIKINAQMDPDVVLDVTEDKEFDVQFEYTVK